MGKISDYTRVLAAKLADVFAVDQTDNGTTETKSATVEQIGTAIGTLQNFADLDTSNKTLVDSINELTTYIPVWNNTASGAIATFDTSLALPLQDCTIAINAVQESGTPTPSSPKAISGFTGANIKQNNKNLLKNIKASTAATVVTLGQSSSSTYETFLKAGTYTISFTRVGGASFGVFYAYDGIGNISLIPSSSPDTSATFTLEHDDYYRFWIYRSGGIEITDIDNFMIEVGNEATAYEAYNSTTIAITWQSEAGTVYGGYLRIVNGIVKLVVTHVKKLMSTWTWSYNDTDYNYGYFVISGNAADMSDNMNFTCDFLTGVKVGRGSLGDNELGAYNATTSNRRLCARADSITDINSWNTFIADKYVKYELATPVEYTLTGIPPISAIVGTNNIFTDTNGDTSVVYACSLKDYIDSQ